MTIKKFKKILMENMSDEFEDYDNKDEDFKFLRDEDVLLCGQDSDETFVVSILKIEWKEERYGTSKSK